MPGEPEAKKPRLEVMTTPGESDNERKSLSLSTDHINLNVWSEAQQFYVRRLTRLFDENNFVVTGQFKRLIDDINSGKSICISGPKGVGKTMSLLAIAALSKEKKTRKCLLVSPTESPKCDYYKPYVTEVFGQNLPYDKFSVLISELSKKHGANLLLLVELGAVTGYDEKQTDNLCDIAEHFGVVQTVIALSSGACHFFGKGSLGVTLSKIIENFSICNYIPFNETEFETFKEVRTGQFQLQTEKYKSLTNFNPRLLNLVASIDDEAEARLTVKTNTLRFLKDIEITLSQSKFQFILSDLSTSIEMISYASTEARIFIGRMDDYRMSWVCMENITYISQKDTNSFTLSLAFPLFFQKLIYIFYLEIRKQDLQKLNRISNRIIDGFYFEHQICRFIKEINIVHSKKDADLSLQPDVTAATFKFSCCLTQPANSAVTGLVEGAIYQLRDFHPVMDAVAYVKDHDGNSWLLLIQVSLSSYKEHKSKASNLFDPVTGIEKCGEKNENWLEYYKKKLPIDKDFRCMYIYISPQDYVEKKNDSLKVYNLREKEHHELFFGCILKNSSSADFVTRTESQLITS